MREKTGLLEGKLQDTARNVWEHTSQESNMIWLESCGYARDYYTPNWDDLPFQVRHELAVEYNLESYYKHAEVVDMPEELQ